jgi:Ca-activated chloride channel family protein
MSARFADPYLLLLVLVIPVLLVWRRHRGRARVLLIPYASSWAPAEPLARVNWRMAALYAAIALLAVAAARPQRIGSREEVISRGYDLVLAIDLSTSMLAEDYRGAKGPINRLDAIRPVIRAFITGRPKDRIGVVLFAGHAYTFAPLTTDHDWLLTKIDALRIGLIEDGTAIGDGLGIALTNLESSRGNPLSTGAFIVLLTDGANTSGSLTPPQATAIASHRHVPTYTIGAGHNGKVPTPIFDDAGRRIGIRMQPSSIDTDALRTIATVTGGRYFRADDSRTIATAFAAIDSAKKADFKVRTHLVVTELFAWAALPAIVLLLLLALPGLAWRRTDAARPAMA